MNQDSIIFAISLVFLSLFAGYQLRKYLRRRRARGWPTAIGRVNATALRYRSAGQLGGAWVARVDYQYAMSGETRAGVHERNFPSKSRAVKWAAAFAPDTPLTVRVDPERPAASLVLESDRA
jgi:Protein of unknown function (DUF3592)